eukprot:Em0015g862a
MMKSIGSICIGSISIGSISIGSISIGSISIGSISIGSISIGSISIGSISIGSISIGSISIGSISIGSISIGSISIGSISIGSISIGSIRGGRGTLCLLNTGVLSKLYDILHVSLFLYQLQGLQDGYNLHSLEPLPPNAFWLLQISGDLEDLEAALGGGGGGSLWAGSCSALVKLLPGNADLLVSQDTWSDYFSMLRTYKLYDLKFSMSSQNKSIVPGSSQSFSSYPGVLLSGDDYYLVNSGLVTMETTIGNNNPDLWKFVVPMSVFENIRAVIVNRLATSGQEWTDMFSMYNSGTYNNEWMVVDYKLFQKGKPLPPNVLWVLDQIPGKIHSC